METALKNMIILVDNREQDTVESKRRYAQFTVPYERSTLKTGDYSAKFLLPDGTWFNLSDKAVVERKNSIDEIAMCFGSERGRFIREFERAKESLMRMWLLIEGASFEKVYDHRYRSRYKPKSLMASLLAWQARYNIRIIMCDRSASGMLIQDILYYEGREAMMQMIDE